MFIKKPRFNYCTTTDDVLYRRFIIRYGFKGEYYRFFYGKGLNPKCKSSMYKFLVSRDLVKWYKLDLKLDLRDDTIFDIVKVKWL